MTRREEVATLAMELPITAGAVAAQGALRRGLGARGGDRRLVGGRAVPGRRRGARAVAVVGRGRHAGAGVGDGARRAVGAVTRRRCHRGRRSRRCARPASGRGRAPPRARRCARCATCSSTARAWGCRTCPETPGRGPGADIIGRAAGLLVDLPVDLQPSGWRFVDRPGRDASRTAALHRRGPRRARRGLRRLRRPAQGAGRRAVDPRRVVAAQPRRAGRRRPGRGGRPRRVARRRHPGLRRRRAAARARGGGRAAGRRAVAAGRARGVAADVVGVRAGARGRPAGRHARASRRCSPPTTARPSCTAAHPSAPLPLLRATGAGALAIDLTAATPARWESVAATLDAGTGVWVGCLPTDGSGTDRGRPGARARGVRAVGAGSRRAARAGRLADLRAGRAHTRGGPQRSPYGARHRAPTRRGGGVVTQQPRVPWQVKYLALVLIWGSSFLLMKVGLESLSAVQISGLRILSGAAVISVLLLARGGRLPTGARVWGHLFVCGFFLGALPFTLFALSETRISSALAGIGNATTPIVAVLATIAILPGERVTGQPARGRARGVPRRRDDHAAVDLGRPARPRRLLDGAGGWRELRHRLDLQPALPQRGRPRWAVAARRDPAHRAGAHGSGDARLGGVPAGGPGGHLVLRRTRLRDVVLAAAGLRARARAGRHRVRLHAPVRRRARRRPGHRLDDHLPDPGGVGAARGVRAR